MPAKTARRKSPPKRAKKTPPQIEQRSFGEIIRSVGEDWIVSGLSIDAEVFQNVIPLLMLSREAWRTNPIFVKYAEQINANCFGENGIMMRSKVKETEDRVVYAAEEKWALLAYERRINRVREWACRKVGREFTREHQYRAFKLADEMENALHRRDSDAVIRGKATVQVGAPDVFANQRIEAWWSEIQRAEFIDVRGRRNYAALRQIRLWGAARDGGHFIRLIKDTGVNRFGFSLQQINDEWCDYFYNTTLPNGNVVRMGIEYPMTSWGLGKPTAYYFIKRIPRDWQTGNRWGGMSYYGNGSTDQRQRVDASEIIHYARFGDIEQTRPAPWGVSVFGKARHLDQAEIAEVIAMRKEACDTGYLWSDLIPEGGTAVAPTDDCIRNAAASIKRRPGGIYGLPHGVKYQANNPTHPSGNFPAVRQAIGQGITSGLPGGDYNVIFNDLNMSFSSGRIGRLDTNEVSKVLQRFDIDTAERTIFESGLEMGMIVGEIPFTFSAAKYKKMNRPKFTGRRWAEISEIDAINAATLRIANFQSNLSIENEQRGQDFEDVLFERAEELMLFDELGVDPTLTVQTPPAAEPIQSQADAAMMAEAAAGTVADKPKTGTGEPADPPANGKAHRKNGARFAVK